MTPLLLISLAIIGYLTSTALVVFGLSKSEKSAWLIRYPLLPAWLAFILHSFDTVQHLVTPVGLNLNFFIAASLVSAIVVLLFLLASLTSPIEKLAIAILPIAATMIGLEAAMPLKSHILENSAWQMDTHVLTSIIAFSLFNIAAFQALLLAFQNYHLRRHNPNRLVLSIPSLQTMESLLFKMLGVGMILLSVSLLTGFMFIDDLFAQHLAHKTVLSILAWIVFGVLLTGRLRYGWRGQTAIRGTLIGFVTLALAYFGSKMVLELILKRV